MSKLCPKWTYLNLNLFFNALVKWMEYFNDMENLVHVHNMSVFEYTYILCIMIVNVTYVYTSFILDKRKCIN